MRKGIRVQNIINGQIGTVVWFGSRIKIKYDSGTVDSVAWDYVNIL